MHSARSETQALRGPVACACTVRDGCPARPLRCLVGQCARRTSRVVKVISDLVSLVFSPCARRVSSSPPVCTETLWPELPAALKMTVLPASVEAALLRSVRLDSVVQRPSCCMSVLVRSAASASAAKVDGTGSKLITR